jgi:hypothetical protein
MYLYVYYFVTLVQVMCAAHMLPLLQWYRICVLHTCYLFTVVQDMCAAHVLPLLQWYRICVLHMYYLCYSGTGCVCCTRVTFVTVVQDMCFAHVLPLNICFCVLVFVTKVNRACFKYICDQVRRCPLTEDDKGLDKVQEG